jgi:hypothetical protein
MPVCLVLELYLSADYEKKRWHYMKASEFDKNFDEGDDIQNILDLSEAKRNVW